MRKQFSLFLIAIFFAVQMGSFAHMAKFGFEHHDHAGHPCQIEAYFHASQSFDSTHAEIAINSESTAQKFIYSFVGESKQVFELLSDNAARAPPSIS